MKLLDFQSEFEKVLDRKYFSAKIHPLREKAFNAFLDIGLPNRKWEDWRFTQFKNISQKFYKISEKKHSKITTFNFAEHNISDVDTITFYNGHYKEEFSDSIPEIQLLNGLEYLEHYNWKYDYPSDCPFELLNTAFMDSGLNIIIKKGQSIKRPIRFLIISSGQDELMVSPKIHIDIENNSSATFIEHHVGNSSDFLINTSIQIKLLENSILDHIRIQSNSSKTTNISNIKVDQSEDSHYNFFQLAFGSDLSRLNLDARLNGKGAECSLNGLSLSNKTQQLGSHIITNHYSPNCNSSQNFKNILQDKSSAIFNGKTVVHKDAQKTDSRQSNKSLLLSENALMNSNPQLEIYADDVKCSHGSTTGALDDDALFYLRSRGLNFLNAQNLLIRGFASELFDLIKHDPTRNFILGKFNNWLNKNVKI